MRTPGQAAAQRFHFLDANIDAHRLQLCREPPVPVAARRLHRKQPIDELGRGFVLGKIAQQMDRLPGGDLQFRAQFDAADQPQTSLLRQRLGDVDSPQACRGRLWRAHPARSPPPP